MRVLEDYRDIVGDQAIFNIFAKARNLYGKRMLHINSTYQGGGVAEILVSLIPLMNDVGIDTEWKVLHGNPDFFDITKKFHNGLQGEKINLTKIKRQLYVEANEAFSVYTHLDDECVVIHDPQPLPLIKFYRKRQPWFWRCHVDLSKPERELWNFLKGFILRYDRMIISDEEYRRKHLPVQQTVMFPAIDPLSPKNKVLSDSDIAKYLKKFKIPTDKPLLTQISRFDKWKDPTGVLEIYKLVSKEVDCRLVLCGSMAPDDPEGGKIFEGLLRRAKPLTESGDVILVTSENSILVNALQRSAAVIIQKSLREGFGLTVAEAMWKSKPVIASNVGGIRLQIQDGENGFLLQPNDIEGFARRTIEILRNPSLAESMGLKAKSSVAQRFLITRLLSDYLDLFNEALRGPAAT